jgi:uncharacterized protein (DUF3820 family)
VGSALVTLTFINWHNLGQQFMTQRAKANDAHVLGGDPKMLLEIARMKMPFGRYEGRVLIDLPEPYIVWFHTNGLPKGRIGVLLGLLYEIKANGLEPLFDELRDPPRRPDLERLEPSVRDELARIRRGTGQK